MSALTPLDDSTEVKLDSQNVFSDAQNTSLPWPDLNDLLDQLEKDTVQIANTFQILESATHEEVGETTRSLVKHMDVLKGSTTRLTSTTNTSLDQHTALMTKCLAMYRELGQLDDLHNQLTLVKAAITKLELQVK